MPNNNLYKGSLSTIVLSLLKERGKMYGYQITREVEKITSGQLTVTEGALYPTLHKLEAKGLLSVEMAKVNNRVRKYYFITEKGKKETVNLLSEMRTFIENMEVFINPKTSAI
jgi:DNA-binding PadR family transcriptional regulator